MKIMAFMKIRTINEDIIVSNTGKHTMDLFHKHRPHH